MKRDVKIRRMARAKEDAVFKRYLAEGFEFGYIQDQLTKAVCWTIGHRQPLGPIGLEFLKIRRMEIDLLRGEFGT